MSNTKPHCSLNYHEFGPTELETFGHGVGEGIYQHNPPFTAPPYTEIAAKALIDTYHNTYEDYKNGGKSQKGDYMAARAALILALDDTAKYVDGLTGLNDAMIVMAGYTPTKTGESKAVIPDAPVIEAIKRGAKGVLEPACKTVPGADYYGCILLDKPWDNTLYFVDGQLVLNGFTGALRHIVTKGRKKTITNLQSKTEYFAYFYAGNSAGVSQLSAVVSEVCG